MSYIDMEQHHFIGGFYLRVSRLYRGIVIFMGLTLALGGAPAPTGRGVLFGGVLS
jgi:hypothetical protein